MKVLKLLFFIFYLIAFSVDSNAQCNQILTINDLSASCNGSGISSVVINVSILFGNGNNSAVISYNLGSSEVPAVVLEDDNGDILNQTYMFDVPSCENYSVSLTGWTNPAGSGSSCNNSVSSPVVLPVEFGFFDISKKGRSIFMEWSTLTETNNEKFVIQRANASGTFNNIGEIRGSLNSYKEIRYEYLDEEAVNGVNYYRLKQIDLDGQFSFSDVRSISVKRELDLMVYPNPAREYIMLSTANNSIYKIIDNFGKVVETVQVTGVNYRYDVSQLNSGIYYILDTDKSEKVSFIKY